MQEVTSLPTAPEQQQVPPNLTHIEVVLTGGALYRFVLDEDKPHHAGFVSDFEERVARNADGIVFVKDDDLTTAVNTAHVVAYFIKKHWTPPPPPVHDEHGHGH